MRDGQELVGGGDGDGGGAFQGKSDDCHRQTVWCSEETGWMCDVRVRHRMDVRHTYSAGDE